MLYNLLIPGAKQLTTRYLDGKVLATPELPYMFEVSHDYCIVIPNVSHAYICVPLMWWYSVVYHYHRLQYSVVYFTVSQQSYHYQMMKEIVPFFFIIGLYLRVSKKKGLYLLFFNFWVKYKSDTRMGAVIYHVNYS